MKVPNTPNVAQEDRNDFVASVRNKYSAVDESLLSYDHNTLNFLLRGDSMRRLFHGRSVEAVEKVCSDKAA